MEIIGKDYKLDLYIDENNIGFDITPDMVGYENVVVFDDSSKKTNSNTLSINIQDGYLKKVMEKIGGDSIYVLNVYVYLFKLKVNRLQLTGKKNGQIVKFTQQSDGFFGIDDLTGTGCCLSVDSYYVNNITQKPIEKCVKVEIRTFKRPDHSNWTVVCTEQMF